MTTHVLRPLFPLALALSLTALCPAAAHASDSSDSSDSSDRRQPHSYGTNPPPNHPPYGLENPHTLSSGLLTDLYGNRVYPWQERNTPPPAFSNPPSKASGPEDSRSWDYHTPSRGCFGEGC
jgi:hypothetical protein